MLDAGAVPAGMDLAQANWFYHNTFLPPGSVAPEWNGDVATGDAGSLGLDYLAAIAARVNAYRWMAGLPGGVTFDPTENDADQLAALMMAANHQLSHDPPPTWIDYSTDGALAAGVSNLAYGISGTGAIDAYMVDSGDNNTLVGHRRWILYPPTRTMGTGDIPSQTNALDVIQPQDPPSPAMDAVAWPPAGFVPAPLVPVRWSLQAPYGSDFTKATVAVTENGVPERVEILDNSGGDYGGEAIVWDMPDAAAPEPGKQTVYGVRVDDVIINGMLRSFSYTTTSFDPSTTTVLAPIPAQVGFLQTNTSVSTPDISVTVEVARSMNTDQPVSVDYTTNDGTALAGKNYVATSGVLTFSPGQFYSQIVVPLLPIGPQGSGGTFSIVLSSPTNTTIGPVSQNVVWFGGFPPPIQFAAPQLQPTDDSGTEGDCVTDQDLPAFFGTVEPDESIKLLDGTNVIGMTMSDDAGSYVVSAQSTLAAGFHCLNITATDDTGWVSASLPIFLDVVPAPDSPSVPAMRTTDDSGTQGDGITDVANPRFTDATQRRRRSRVTRYERRRRSIVVCRFCWHVYDFTSRPTSAANLSLHRRDYRPVRRRERPERGVLTHDCCAAGNAQRPRARSCR